MESHDFCWALRNLKNGKKVCRDNWNGKNMWIALQTPDVNSKMQLPYLYMSTAQGLLVPWIASHTDLLSCDWSLIY